MAGYRLPTVSRRSLLIGGAGTAVLVALPNAWIRSRADATTAITSVEQLFLYGVSDSPDAEPYMATMRGASGAVVPVAVATDLATPPVVSPDGSQLALVTVNGSGVPTSVTMSVLDRATGAVAASDQLALPRDLPADTQVLAQPVFAGSSNTIVVVLSLTVPSNLRTVTKPNVTGGQRTISAATWTSRHALAYFSRSGGRFGPLTDLRDTATLARVNAAADEQNLYLWTVGDATALPPSTPEHPFVRPATQLSVFPLGSGVASSSQEIAGAWPVNDEPVVIRGDGRVFRLAYGHQLEILDTTAGTWSASTLPSVSEHLAKAARTSMVGLKDGRLFVSNPALGVASVVDPDNALTETNVISFPPSRYARGGPVDKVALSPEEDSFYVVGGQDTGGVAHYDINSGALLTAYTNGVHYSGLIQLPSGTIVTVGPYAPRVAFFNPTLVPLGTAETELHVAALS